MKKREIDYRAFFAIGVVFMGAGVTFLVSVNKGVGAGLIGIGALYMIISVKNKDKWKK